MGFFKDLSIMVENQDLKMFVRKNGEELIVTLLPEPKVDDEAKDNLIPIVLKGTPEELDENVKESLLEPLKVTSDLSNNLLEFEKSAKKFAEENKAKAEIKKKESDKLSKAEKDLDKVKDYIDKKEFDKADFLIKTVLDIKENHKKAKELQEEVKKAKGGNQVDIFSVIEEEEKQQPQQEEVGCSGDEDCDEEFEDCNSPLTEEDDDIDGETDQEIKDALINFDIQEKAKDNYDPMMEEQEFWAKREYEASLNKPSFIRR